MIYKTYFIRPHPADYLLADKYKYLCKKYEIDLTKERTCQDLTIKWNNCSTSISLTPRKKNYKIAPYEQRSTFRSTSHHIAVNENYLMIYNYHMGIYFF